MKSSSPVGGANLPNCQNLLIAGFFISTNYTPFQILILYLMQNG